MKEDKEKWIDAVFDSLQGSTRAKPGSGLFAKIENQIDGRDARFVPLPQWRIAVAAAVVLLCLNVFTVRQYLQSSKVATEAGGAEEASDQALLSNYKLYE